MMSKHKIDIENENSCLAKDTMKRGESKSWIGRKYLQIIYLTKDLYPKYIAICILIRKRMDIGDSFQMRKYKWLINMKRCLISLVLRKTQNKNMNLQSIVTRAAKMIFT